MGRYDRESPRRRMGMHDFSERGGYDPGFRSGLRGGSRRARESDWIGGMRSDAGETRWDRFAGEEGWYGEGYGGYPGADARRFARYGGEYRADYGRGAGIREARRSGGELGWDRAGERFESDWGGAGWQSDADRVRARDIMTEEPECVTPQTSVADVAKKMRELDVGIIPVVDSVESRRLRGVITDRDLAIRVLAAGRDGTANAGDFMTEQVETVNKNDSVHAVLDLMKREQVRRVPVTDREGRLVGIIAQADLAVSYAGLDLQRETEVEEAIERISEPARPRRG